MVEPGTEAGQELYAEGLDQVQRLADARRTRLVAAEESLPTVLWVVLIVGGLWWWASPTSSAWRTRGRTR
jgi:hypothetical protein